MADDKAASLERFERIKQLNLWVGALQETLPLDDVIQAVKARRRGADQDDSYSLALQLEALLIAADRETEADRLIDEMLDRFPEDVRFAISKATLHHYFMDDQEGALNAIDMALERAQRTGFFRREALGVKARILLRLGRGDELTQTLDEIMALEMKPGIPDIGRERDFVDRAPPGMISEDVLARYNLFRPKRVSDDDGRSDVDEPPEWDIE